MKLSITVLFLVLMACAEKPTATPPKLKRAPSLALVQTSGVEGVVDTDQFDALKYVEGSGSNSDISAAKAKRDSHDDDLTHQFFGGFNATRECDGIIFKGKGDQQPDFTLQVMVDSHDTPGQKPVWIWILSDGSSKKFLAKGEEDTGALAAKSVCQATVRAAQDAELKASQR